MRRYRGIVIGCGKIGVLFETVGSRPRPRSHAGALAENDRTELAAFVGRDEQECARARSYFTVPTYTDVVTGINETKPDIAILATPTETHVSLALLCANHRVPMIIGEKPLASDMPQALELLNAIKESGSVFALNYQRRFFPLFARAKERLRAGEIGRVTEVTCLYDNGLYNNGGHAIDSVLFLLGTRMVSATGKINVAISTHPENDENIDGAVTTAEGTRITLKSFDQKVSPIHELQFAGERGSLRIADYGYSFEWRGPNGERVEDERDEVSMTAGVLADVIEAYEEHRPPRSGIGNGIETLAVLEALRESAAGNGCETEVAVHF